MKHKWKDNKCIVCGCIRIYEYYAEKRGFYMYSRSGMQFFNKPECIDWQDNTIINPDEMTFY